MARRKFKPGGRGKTNSNRWTVWKERIRRWRLTLVHSKTYLRTAFLSIAVLCMIGFAVSGFTRIHHVAYVKSMTVSTVNQDLAFSKTGVSVQLKRQFRNGNLTIIPLKFASTDAMTTNANKYKIFFKLSNQHHQLGPIKTSFVIFGTTGEAAIVIDGHLPKEPLQVLVRDDLPLPDISMDNGEDTGGSVDTNNGPGSIYFDGQDNKIDYDAIAFRVNPKGSNVKVDHRINRRMPLSVLYGLLTGYQTIAKQQHKIKNLKKVQSANLVQQKQYYQQLAQVNKVLGLASADLSSGAQVDSSADQSGVLQSNRESIINNIQTAQQNTSTYQTSLASAKQAIGQEQDLIESMNNYASMSSRYDTLQ